PALGAGGELEPVHADVDDAVDTDEPLGIRARTSADAGDEPVASDEPRDFGSSRLRHGRQFGPRDDRRERPVDVEQDRRRRGLGCKPCDQGVGGHPRTIGAMVRLLVIGAAAGVFSALFGVGGGIIIVPLLIYAAGFAPRAATGTSLAALAITAA